jgi:hypothetical protein
MRIMSAGTGGTATSVGGGGSQKDKHKLHTEVSQPIKDKLHVQDLITGGKEKLSVGTSGLTTGQDAQSGGTGKQKLQTEVLQFDKDKSHDQDSGSSGASSGSGPRMHHGKH